MLRFCEKYPLFSSSKDVIQKFTALIEEKGNLSKGYQLKLEETHESKYKLVKIE